MIMSENVLFIPPIPQYGVIIENPEQVRNSIFYDVYQRAAYNVEKITKSNETLDDKKNCLNREDFLNTIVAFTGDRGSGKSSAMLSFAKMLKEPPKDIRNAIDSSIFENRFWVLSALDSTKMGNGEQLLSSIAARMLKVYQKRLNSGDIPHTVTVEQKREFLTQIQKVTRESMISEAGRKEDDESILLQNAAELIDSRDSVETLVDLFLKMMFKESDKAYLVVMIDDLDMNLSDSYKIVDDIRKYLTIPRVIVLTSICIDQFRELAGIHFSQLFSRGAGRGRGNTAEMMAQKYIEKMFPVSRQVEMPRFSLEQQKRTLIGNLLGENPERKTPVYSSRTGIGLPVKDENKDASGNYDKINIIDGVLHLIYRKTMLLLVPDKSGRHWIVPENLRELCNLIYFLQGMEDAAFKSDPGHPYVPCIDVDFLPKTESDQEKTDPAIRRLNTVEINLRKLMQYIVSDLLDYNSSSMSRDVIEMAGVLSKLIRELPDWPLTDINKKIVRDILNCMTSDNSYRLFFDKDLRDSLLKASMHDNLISMGDVQHVLGAVSRRSNDETIRKLVEYIQVIWSIRMTLEFYCVGVRYSSDTNYRGLYESGQTFITRDFRDTVGGMMFSPDAKTQLLKYQNPNTDFYKIWTDGSNWLYLSIGDEEEMKKSVPITLMFVFLDNCEPVDEWRTYISLPYYRSKIDGIYEFCLHLNYFAIFTNLLSPMRTYFSDKYGKSGDKNMPFYLAWVREHVMVFPFYSMDWTNRFYAETASECLSDPPSDSLVEGAITHLEAHIKTAFGAMEGITRRYIPQDGSQKLTGNNYSYRFASLFDKGGIGDSVKRHLQYLNNEKLKLEDALEIVKENWCPEDCSSDKTVLENVKSKLLSDDPSNPIALEDQAVLSDILEGFNNKKYIAKPDSIIAKYLGCRQFIDEIIKKLPKSSDK